MERLELNVFCTFLVAITLSSSLVAQSATSDQSPGAEQNSSDQSWEQTSQDPGQKPVNPSSGAAAQATPTPQQSHPDTEKQKRKEEQSKRILGVFPQFSTTSRHDAQPLTSDQKFHLFVKNSFDPFQFAFAAFEAGVGQATNSFPGYGQGAAGYGKRYAASFADLTSGNFFAGYVYPSLLKQDPRYFRSGKGSVTHRIFYSFAQAVVCRTDKGGRSFNWSNVLGVFTAGTISNAYYPSSDRGVGLTASRSAVNLAYGSIGGLLDEFWPDIERKFFHKNNK